ncbi:GTP cyclohydrolase II [Amphritea sp. 1_MG-2023]|uniref:GTP cyclohydrolase II n=1 Tax=Amphritea sp. 1_MG-2023 TaxID=3062670 RepID=UPI0026E212F1|nr:GTP cyclohydrolase II [Amphritea sp. 1_MG-2023]MDO6564742.1 GTP cyclohydrolase II [Amphritea sp. 1_MG-2023]
MSIEAYLATLTDAVSVRMPTAYGEFSMTVFSDPDDAKEHIILVMGQPHLAAAPIVRIHSECATGDLFASSRCDCGEQLDRSLSMIGKVGCGVLIYLRQEGRGIGLKNKLRAYQLQDQGLDTVDANRHLGLPVDSRSYEVAATVLNALNISTLRLLTNNPDKISSLEAFGFVVSRVPIQVDYQSHNLPYMQAKQLKMGHLVSL